ncbi:restriction endonuclease subunit S [Faecalibaculum rodentium]|uniref:restriction endonuclease subunit S n=1 Tax=Faecalibaculum rodentium TaxID=1702221 RepID=UPI0023F12C4F|nr:restriction endonuclease subunit S [Faecalibaculum rodentium]
MKLEEFRLSQVADIKTGPFGSQLHKGDYQKEGTPIVTVEHLGSRQFREQNLPRVADKDRTRLSQYLLQPGDIVFSRVGSVDRSAYVTQEQDGWLFSGRCLRVRPKTGINSLYLYYVLNDKRVKSKIRKSAVGATMPSINTQILGELEVSLPPIETQNKVAKVLDALDSKIELNSRINKNLDNLNLTRYESR